ncbi:MAG: hypothetical protein QOJ29_316 [Thermoleophilaceae bacterium]|nr:hypothetical protein [Thermoleophilaceae bacterium]
MRGAPFRTRAARLTALLASRLSRFTGGEGAAISGRVFLALATEQAVRDLVTGPAVVVISGTNGKTTTSALITLSIDDAVSNSTGANLSSGIISTFLARSTASTVVLEVDELVLATTLELVKPAVVALLNLSRDQLDRSHEVRRIAESWRDALASFGGVLVANVDDPLITWAAQSASSVRWVAAGQPWHADAFACPSCSSHALSVDVDNWRCDGCGFERPQIPPEHDLTFATGLPGRCNISNALIARAVLAELRQPVNPEAWAAMSSVAGRYARRVVGDVDVRLLLSKNPAGWLETFEILEPDASLVLALNARVQDGQDTSWIWDVPFERLAGTKIVCSGERAADIALRLHYAGIEAVVERDLARALQRTATTKVDLVANYTAFQQALSVMPGHA